MKRIFCVVPFTAVLLFATHVEARGFKMRLGHSSNTQNSSHSTPKDETQSSHVPIPISRSSSHSDKNNYETNAYRSSQAPDRSEATELAYSKAPPSKASLMSQQQLRDCNRQSNRLKLDNQQLAVLSTDLQWVSTQLKTVTASLSREYATASASNAAKITSLAKQKKALSKQYAQKLTPYNSESTRLSAEIGAYNSKCT